MEEVVFSQAGRETLDRIKKHFGFLFVEHGFKVAHQRDATYGPRFLIILESAQCRLRFTSEYGVVSLDIGDSEAPLGWSDDRSDSAKWYPLRAVTYFLQGAHRPSIEESRELAGKLQAMSPEEKMVYLAAQLRPVLEEACVLLARDSSPERRKAFEDFVAG